MAWSVVTLWLEKGNFPVSMAYMLTPLHGACVSEGVSEGVKE